MLASYVLQEVTSSYSGWYIIIEYFFDQSGYLGAHGGTIELRLERKIEGGVAHEAEFRTSVPFRYDGLTDFYKKFPNKFPLEVTLEENEALHRDLVTKLTQMSLSPIQDSPPYFFEEDARTQALIGSNNYLKPL